MRVHVQSCHYDPSVGGIYRYLQPPNTFVRGWRSNTAVSVGAAVVWLPAVTRRHLQSALPSQCCSASPEHSAPSRQSSGDLTSRRILDAIIKDELLSRAAFKGRGPVGILTHGICANTAQKGLLFFSSS